MNQGFCLRLIAAVAAGFLISPSAFGQLPDNSNNSPSSDDNVSNKSPNIADIPRSLDAYKKNSGIAAEVWNALERFFPPDLAEKHKRLPAYIDIGSRSKNLSNPEKYYTSVGKWELEKAEGGYLFTHDAGDGENAKLKNTQLSVLRLFPVVSQNEVELQIALASSSSVGVQRLSNVKFSQSFNDMVKPGASWAYELEYNFETYTKGKFISRSRKSTLEAKHECVNAQRIEASTLHSKFTGSLIPITCKVHAKNGNSEAYLNYLEDYGIFISSGRKSEKTEVENIIQDVGFDTALSR